MTTYEVIQEDIDRGVPKSCTDCPVALAMQRTHASHSVSVSYRYAQISNPKQNHFQATELPGDVKQWIRDFDQNKAVKPFTFTLP